ncbi:MAG: glutathione S-transferase [Oleiphilaceae bacterium]|jgi:glutathione S-transferase
MADDIIWGVELSCFTLKLQACLHHAGRPYRRLPDQGGYFENTRTLLSLACAKYRKQVTRYPSLNMNLDEYPAVPFLSHDGKHFQYDSSAIAQWLDTRKSADHSALYPEKPALRFIAQLIDEAFDEFGLYLVHHMRWVGSAKSNRMGKRLAKEFRHALPPVGPWLLSKSFPRRQVRRCPYLFSIAPLKYKSGVSKSLTPSARVGFPETHSLLNHSWKKYLHGMETILAKQAYLLGDQFTIADASAYGQLGMNLVDPETSEKMQKLAPHTYAWLNRIDQHKHSQQASASLYLSEAIKPLLSTIMLTFSALMVQNAQAYKFAKLKGETLFNEAAFDQGKALYDGKLCGYPFRSVVKTFQVRVWDDIQSAWSKLTAEEKDDVKGVIELCELFEL